MATIAAVYTGQGLSGLVQAVFNEQLPGHKLVNIIDDGIIHQVMRDGKVTKAIVRRLFDYYRTAADAGADYIINTCSSVGEVAELGQRIFDVPILRIDEPMARKAIQEFDRVGVIATLPTTLAPTVRLLTSKAGSLGKAVSIQEGLAEGAYQALIGGKPEEHDALIAGAAEKLARQCDCIVLAQGSMARMQEKLAGITGKVVLSSPSLCIAHLKSLIEAGGEEK